MNRKSYNNLIDWKNKDETNVLFIYGVRQVGKTKLAEKLAKNEFKSYIRIDFRNINREIKKLFKTEIHDLDLFFIKLSAFYKTKLYENKSLIILDEIKDIKNIDSIIKFISDDDRYKVIAICSNKERKNTSNINYKYSTLNLSPLDFFEFLSVNGDNTTEAMIKTAFLEKRKLGESLHNKILNDYALYTLIGGMPQVVNKYIETKKLDKVEKLKKEILSTYENEMKLLSKNKWEKTFAIYNKIAKELENKNKIFKISTIDKKARFREYEKHFSILENHGFINISYNCDDENFKNQSHNHFTRRCYMNDTGLLITKYLIDTNSKNLYNELLFGNLFINNGMFMQNSISQILHTNNFTDFFFSRIDKNKRKNHIEIDFIVKVREKIIALNAQTSKFRKSSAIDKFSEKYHKKIDDFYILNLSDINVNKTSKNIDIIELPIYMLPCILNNDF